MIDTAPLNEVRIKILEDIHSNLERTSGNVLDNPMTKDKILAGMKAIYEFPKELADARERAAQNGYGG
jgi:hypothetical protein